MPKLFRERARDYHSDYEEDLELSADARDEETLAESSGEEEEHEELDAELKTSFLEEKFLISAATKGVVKLFNAVNKAQNPQKGLNPSMSKDAKGRL
ncbi:hypothetical protein J5N97_016738 [Dioscorea zingiberensis]|uniref:RRP15-like protein n=1 Tax=Dioscorea zingiberensis TaxID=325984 RepID=A0A9D5CK13_9LILI|nr:hypothetical protein J5N97_016738 [Dioscorea zingiberensis]